MYGCRVGIFVGNPQFVRGDGRNTTIGAFCLIIGNLPDCKVGEITHFYIRKDGGGDDLFGDRDNDYGIDGDTDDDADGDDADGDDADGDDADA